MSRIFLPSLTYIIIYHPPPSSQVLQSNGESEEKESPSVVSAVDNSQVKFTCSDSEL